MIKTLLPSAFALVLALTNLGAPETDRTQKKFAQPIPNHSNSYQTAEQLRRPEIWEIDRENPFEADEYTDEEYESYDNRNLTPNTIPQTLAAPSYSLTNYVVAPGVTRIELKRLVKKQRIDGVYKNVLSKRIQMRHGKSRRR